jgi:poly(hydroxyalkanoate) granule-associated protein
MGKKTVKESAQQIWLAGLGAFAKAQEEGNKVFDALVKEGENIQSKTRKLTDDKIAAVAGKAAGTWDRLEQVFEDRVARSLSSLGVPSKKDIDKLNKRVAELTAVVQELTEAKAKADKNTIVEPRENSDQEPAEEVNKKVAAKPAAKPAAKKAAVEETIVLPVLAEAVAKPLAKKPAAKKVAAKPAASSEAVTSTEVLKSVADSNG